MTEKSKTPWFPLAATAIFSVFMTVLVVVTIVAYTRQHGRTEGLDMAAMQLLRAKASQQQQPVQP